MTRNDLKSLSLPDSPGVYIFRNATHIPLYIGKATSLRDRVRSYFNVDILASRGPKLEAMLTQAVHVDVEETDSVLEALILEAALIKKYHPPYNSCGKDDKSFNYIVITQEAFPRVLVYRGRTILQSPPVSIADLFGPFPSASTLRTAMTLIRRLFPYRDNCIPGSGIPCFNRQIGLCPGVCTGECSKTEYRHRIHQLRLFFEGKKSEILRQLHREMTTRAKELEFEKANAIKKTIFGLTHIQDVSLVKTDLGVDSAEARGASSFRIEAYDIAHLSGTHMVGVMTVVENGTVKKSDYRKFKIRGFTSAHDPGALQEVLKRRLTHPEWRTPHLIVVDGSTAQRNAALTVLREYDLRIPVVAVVKNPRHRPERLLGPKSLIDSHERAILLANSEAHRFAITYHRQLRGKRALR